jgi:hypothetical protein
MDPNSRREIDDLYQCIEWAGTQPWSNGKDNRPRDVFGGRVTLHAGVGREPYLLLPIIPATRA